VERPSSDADYLRNPTPPYPAISRSLREEGTVIVQVLVGADGVAHQAQVKTSSGFDRLDRAAQTAAQSWRYIPGKRNGVPTAMPYDVPITFRLN
jgi:protein TonB